MAEPLTEAQGLFGRAGRTVGSMWLWLQCRLYSRNMLGSFGRVLKMIFTGRFGALAAKIRQLRSTDRALDAYNRPVEVVRTGPPLHLAGNIHGHGGYDHLVLKALVGLTNAGVHVFRDKRSFMDSAYVPAEFAPSERMYDWRGPRLAIIPPHILHLYKPTETTAAWTMWETDTLPVGSAIPEPVRPAAHSQSVGRGLLSRERRECADGSCFARLRSGRVFSARRWKRARDLHVRHCGRSTRAGCGRTCSA